MVALQELAAVFAFVGAVLGAVLRGREVFEKFKPKKKPPKRKGRPRKKPTTAAGRAWG